MSLARFSCRPVARRWRRARRSRQIATVIDAEVQRPPGYERIQRTERKPGNDRKLRKNQWLRNKTRKAHDAHFEHHARPFSCKLVAGQEMESGRRRAGCDQGFLHPAAS